MKYAKKIDESASDVVGCGLVTGCHQCCGGATDSVHRQSGGHSCCAWKMVTRSRYVFLEDGDFCSRDVCVFLKPLTSGLS